MTSEEWQCEKFPCLSPWCYNHLNSYNSTKGSLLSIRTCLSDPHIETFEGGQVTACWRGGKGERQRWIHRSNLKLRRVLKGGGISLPPALLKEQRDRVGSPEEVIQGRDTEVRQWRSGSCPYWEETTLNVQANLSQLTLLPPTGAALPSDSACRGWSWDCRDSEPHCPAHSPQKWCFEIEAF